MTLTVIPVLDVISGSCAAPMRSLAFTSFKHQPWVARSQSLPLIPTTCGPPFPRRLQVMLEHATQHLPSQCFPRGHPALFAGA
ncbi:uncharacterized protein UDID_02474 [Ustilago sp. UG-2017a]|nr:uncharacterized protein UDID_02474 [Ustilago sp. UG-2017a]SPC66920.1 uncharacterized protein UHOD_02474 [Ustilago sp. UG-2017b]